MSDNSKANWKQIKCPVSDARAYRWGFVLVFVAQESEGWHLSISRPDKHPSWEEIKQARYDLIPSNVTMAMIFPPPDEFVNIHEHCFHLFQIPGDRGDY